MWRSALSFGFLGIALSSAFAEGCSEPASTNSALVNCKPGAYFYCRCKNRDEGTKLCNADGHSFERCDPCESPNNPVEEEDPNTQPFEVDSGKTDSAPPTSACGNKTIQDGEECDDGNAIEDDGCDSHCHLAGANPAASRSCPGLPVHVWTKPVSYKGTTEGSTNTAAAHPACVTAANGTRGATGGTQPDRVFAVVAHATGTMTVATSDVTYDSFVYATKSCSPQSGEVTTFACANGKAGVGPETLEFPVTNGQTYYVIVDGTGLTAPSGAFRATFSIR